MLVLQKQPGNISQTRTAFDSTADTDTRCIRDCRWFGRSLQKNLPQRHFWQLDLDKPNEGLFVTTESLINAIQEKQLFHHKELLFLAVQHTHLNSCAKQLIHVSCAAKSDAFSLRARKTLVHKSFASRSAQISQTKHNQRAMIYITHKKHRQYEQIIHKMTRSAQPVHVNFSNTINPCVNKPAGSKKTKQKQLHTCEKRFSNSAFIHTIQLIWKK